MTRQADGQDIAAFGLPSVKVFDDRAGLPQNSVLDIAFDRAGYLWVATEDGAARYNSRAWTTVPMPNRTTSNFIRCLLPASDGGMWFGTHGGGLIRLRDGQWDLFGRADGLPDDIVISLLETRARDGSPVVWAGTRAGLARYAGGRWHVYDRASGLPHDVVVALEATVDDDGVSAVWAGTRGGLGRVGRGGCQVPVLDGGLPDQNILALRETVDSDGRRTLWIGTSRGGLARLRDGRLDVVDTESGLPANRVYCLVEAVGRTDPAVWAGTQTGLVAVGADGTCTVYDTRSGLPDSAVLSLCETAPSCGTRHLWVGTDGGGIARFEASQWVSFTTGTGLPDNGVLALCESMGAGGAYEMWFGTDNGLGRYRAGTWATMTPADGLPDFVVPVVERAGAPDGGGLFVGTAQGGLVEMRDGALTVHDRATGLPVDAVLCVLDTVDVDGASVLWVGSDKGLTCRKGGKWHHVSTAALGNQNVRCLLETTARDGGRVLWVGTRGGGLARLAGASWTVFDRSSGLPNDDVASLHMVESAGGARRLWVGTQSGGVAIADPDAARLEWTILDDASSPQLPNNTINQIQVDVRGRVYLFTNRGVARLTPPRPTAADPSEFAAQTFTTEDGLPSNECNAGAAVVDRLGRIWAGTVGGAAMLDPSVEIDDRVSKPLHISRTVVGGKQARLDGGAALAHDENDVTIEFDLLSYFREADTRYRTQLVGFDDGPSEWTPECKRTYTNLPAGRYTFTVWGRDYAGNVSGPETLPFSIRPAPWRTWWAYAGYVGLTAGAAYGGVRWRLHTLRRRTEVLEETVQRQTAELAAKVDLLRRSESITREKAEELARVVDQLRVAESLAQRAKSEAIAAKDKAIEASHAKSVFLSNMSHELRTPLNAVLGFAQLMERDTALSPDQREHLTAIMSSGEHLLHLINDVLSLSKIEAGKLALTVQPFDLHRTLDGVEAMLRGRTRAKGLEFLVERSEKLPQWVLGDEGKLRQVLINLLGNAVKFTPGGGVTLRARWRDGLAEFEVKDTGYGIDADEVETLFEPFVQTESGRRSKEGTGLGLAISRNFVQMMGGDIRVRSALGAGSAFSFDVELAEVAEGDERAGRPVVLALEPGQPEYRVLIVDDAERNREILVKLLSSVGFAVSEATDGREAVAVWASWRPDLILMDMRMPTMDGRSATLEIRNLEQSAENRGPSAEASEDSSAPYSARGTRHCVIISLTASAFEHERDEILAAGCDDFLTKPFREDLLFQKLATHLGVRFRYGADRDDGEAARARQTSLVPGRLRALPVEWLMSLNDAVVKGDVEQANRIVDGIHDRDAALADELRDLIKGYRFDEIQELIEQIPQ